MLFLSIATMTPLETLQEGLHRNKAFGGIWTSGHEGCSSSHLTTPPHCQCSNLCRRSSSALPGNGSYSLCDANNNDLILLSQGESKGDLGRRDVAQDGCCVLIVMVRYCTVHCRVFFLPYVSPETQQDSYRTSPMIRMYVTDSTYCIYHLENNTLRVQGEQKYTHVSRAREAFVPRANDTDNVICQQDSDSS